MGLWELLKGGPGASDLYHNHYTRITTRETLGPRNSGTLTRITPEHTRIATERITTKLLG